MKNNHELIPAIITDKNGKITTVYKKPQNTTVTMPLPSPSLPQHKSINDVRTAVIERVAELYNMTHESGFDYRPSLAKGVQRYLEETLHIVDLALRKDGDLAQGVAKSIVHGESELIVKESIHYYEKTNSDNYWRTVSEVRALRHYTAVNIHMDLTEVDSNIQKSCIALMRFPPLIDVFPRSPFLNYSESDHYFINNDDLATLITQRPDDIEKIAEIVLQYGTSDAAAINGLLDGALPALAEGHL